MSQQDELSLSIGFKKAYYNMAKADYRIAKKELIKTKVKYLWKFKKIFLLKRCLIFSLIVVGFIGSFYYLLNNPLTITNTNTKFVYVYDKDKTHENFLKKLGEVESSGDYKSRREGSKYLGKYQIGPEALSQIGMSVAPDVFLSTPELQDVAINLLLKENKKTLAKYIGKFQGKVVKDIYITESSILAMAHLKGPNAAIEFLESDGKADSTDANNTPVSRYAKIFSGYKLKF